MRADAVDAVAALAAEIDRRLPGAEVVTAADLADRVGGSLDDVEDLSSTLGTALAAGALAAAFLIATLVTLSSVQKRTRELGTLKALGWRQCLVVRQVTGESLVHGALGGLLGAVIGIAGATTIDAIGPTLEAYVENPSSRGLGPFGQGGIAAGTTDVVLAPPWTRVCSLSRSASPWSAGWSRARRAGCARRDYARPRPCGALSDRPPSEHGHGDHEHRTRRRAELRAGPCLPVVR